MFHMTQNKQCYLPHNFDLNNKQHMEYLLHLSSRQAVGGMPSGVGLQNEHYVTKWISLTRCCSNPTKILK